MIDIEEQIEQNIINSFKNDDVNDEQVKHFAKLAVEKTDYWQNDIHYINTDNNGIDFIGLTAIEYFEGMVKSTICLFDNSESDYYDETISLDEAFLIQLRNDYESDTDFEVLEDKLERLDYGLSMEVDEYTNLDEFVDLIDWLKAFDDVPKEEIKSYEERLKHYEKEKQEKCEDNERY